MKKFFSNNKTALLLSLLYFVPGILWIFFSDRLSGTDSSGLDEKYKRLDTIRDGIFVASVSIMLFLLFYFYKRSLTRTRQEYEYLFEHHPQPMWIYQLDTRRVVAVNLKVISSYGYTREEFVGMRLEVLHPREEIGLINDYLSTYQRGLKATSIWNHIKKNGEIITVEISANDVIFNGEKCRLVCSVDITERINSQLAIKQLSLVAENATNGVIILDKDSRIEWVNNSFTKLTGYDLQQVIGKSPSSFLHGPATSQKAELEIRDCIEKGKQYAGEILNYRKDGSTFWLRLTISPVKTYGQVSKYVVVQTDITAIKNQNEKLHDLVISASHGVRKPLANIMGLINVIHAVGNDVSVLAELEYSAQELDREVKMIVDKIGEMED